MHKYVLKTGLLFANSMRRSNYFENVAMQNANVIAGFSFYECAQSDTIAHQLWAYAPE